MSSPEVGRLPVRNSTVLSRAGALSVLQQFSSPREHSCHSSSPLKPNTKKAFTSFGISLLESGRKIFPRSLTSLPSTSQCPGLGYVNTPKVVTVNGTRSLWLRGTYCQEMKAFQPGCWTKLLTEKKKKKKQVDDYCVGKSSVCQNFHSNMNIVIIKVTSSQIIKKIIWYNFYFQTKKKKKHKKNPPHPRKGRNH